MIRNDYVSKFHAMLVMRPVGLVLADLKSANGTLVNSRTVSCTVLRDNDIISIGKHGMKVLNAPATGPTEAQSADSETTTMKTILDYKTCVTPHLIKSVD